MQRADGDRQRRQELADVSSGHLPRLLPWTTDDGKRCLLSADTEGGFLSRLADDFEAAQLGLGSDMVTEASTVLGNPMATHAEVRYATLRLSECLTDVLRIAESRGLRLSVPDGDEDDDSPAASAEAVG
ncbi:hypothetical protein OG194_28470 [Streptomyces sp. NBC_01288]|uniref:hypothetical protein n=1 Tax=Streptomyces sp. NBC_01288 TaxID=2903814 RepID=UPI002E0E3546|nr:hypothetical protein OG194_28470 [Streptomyces sp. NBC_01288]